LEALDSAIELARITPWSAVRPSAASDPTKDAPAV
jgi:hypothetical protein